MRKTKNIDILEHVTVNTKTLQGMLNCGRETAVKIGTEANARIKIGRRVLWDVGKIKEYVKDIND